MDPFLITGVPGSPPVGQNPALRLEINDFVQNQKFFSLYIQALTLLYSEPQDELLSFFEISGIHGLPYVDWNQSPNPGNGYCVHGTDLFPTWHRPYVALFEQVIQKRAVDIAGTYTTSDAAAWRQAAADLRQPYWNWAANSVPPDVIIASEQVTIIAPDGTSASVGNPFLSYRFHPIDPTFPTPFHNWPTTLRYPTSSDSDAQSDVNQLRSRLAAAQAQITQDTNRIFSITDWRLFSNHTAGSGGSSNSLESIHDTIHVLVGGNGHMTSVPVAAFDPIFYLHHCQVDRLLALWSSVHPDVWVPDGEANTALTPFWNTATTFWASSNVKDFGAALNYTYPDFVTGAGTANVSLTSIGTAQGQPRAALPARPQAARPARPQAAVSARSQAALSAGPSTVVSSSLLEWSARIRFKQFELGGSFSVLLFLVEVPNNPADYYTSRHYVGSFHAFVNSSPEGCANCLDHVDQEVEGFVHINEAVMKHSGEESLDPVVVTPFLTKNLHWRVLKVDGTVAQLPSLEVVVLTAPLTLPEGAKYPVVGDPTHYHGVTRGRPGGSRF